MNFDDIERILELVREHDLTEFELERDGLKLRVRKSGGSHHHAVQETTVAPGVQVPIQPPLPPLLASVAPPPALSDSSAPDETELEFAVVKSPIVGTFYRSSEPGSAPFVEVGEQVKKDQVLCIIEAMKLMNEITSEYEGEVVSVYVENGKPVQYGERLFAIKTA
jgi:acetyl-CoA carboxylase biotin carboxyl carrier protein